ncbi:MAG TPA: DUF58 domain-containing protein [Longimicrobiales bacterium]|nr:DUF58 domain-containing protein [Longimicrobiales bacterium]
MSGAGAELDRLELDAVGLADALLAGASPSVFRGDGMEPAGLRPYVPGDDVRSLDWRVTARAGKPHVRERIEERAVELRIVLDRSASLLKRGHASAARAARDTAATLAAAGCRQTRPTALLQFSESVGGEVEPGSGRGHLRRLLSAIHAPFPPGHGTGMARACDRLAGTLRFRTLLMVISDFLLPAEEWMRAASALARMARAHDVVLLRVRTRGPGALPSVGRVRIRDPESGEVRVVDPGPAARRLLEGAEEEREARWRGLVRAPGVTPVELAPDGNLVTQLAAGLAMRHRRGA